jgi:chemotaxis protein CheX
MNYNPKEILQIASIIWETTLGLPITPEIFAGPPSASRSTAACIQITGAWNGAILLDCPADIARLVASIMFSTDEDKVSVNDLQDAVAELANMIGGHVKALLPGTCYLSLPAVIEGGDYSHRVPGSKLLGRVGFNCNGHAVSIAVLEREATHYAAA